MWGQGPLIDCSVIILKFVMVPKVLKLSIVPRDVPTFMYPNTHIQPRGFFCFFGKLSSECIYTHCFPKNIPCIYI